MRYRIRVDFTEAGDSIATDFDVLSLSLRAPLHFVDFDMTASGAGHLAIETDNEVDAFLILFSFENAVLG